MPRPRSERVAPNQVLSHLGVMAVVAAIMGVVVAGLAIPFAGVAGLAARDLSGTMKELPAELETKALPQRTRILAANGQPIATLYDENRVNVPLTQVAEVMRQAIVSIEDYRFYQHGALDVKGTLRAFVTNQAAGGVVQGGSSITQQMVKLTLLQQAKTDKERKAAKEETIARKMRELRYAIAFEEKYSKDWILERYLNIAYFGDGVYGVQAAARHYFSVSANKLNLGQAATLAGLVKNPVGYDPTTYPNRALNRRNVVLDRMAQLSVITPQVARAEKARPLGLKLTQSRNGCVESLAPFFCSFVISYLKADPSLGETPQQREQLLFSGGLTIKTTLDPRFQRAAVDSVREHVYKEDSAIGALAMIEPRTGSVRALAQSRPMGRNKAAGETFLNYTVSKKHGGSRGFSPGSTFKAFVLAAAIKQKIPLTTDIYSPEKISIPLNSFRVCGGKPYRSTEIWEPSNSTKSGTMDLYTGTRLSVNTFYAQLERMTGLCEPFNLAKAMGVQLTNPKSEMVPSFTLGVGDASPLEMAEAYATFAGRGLHCDARPVTAILDSNNTPVKSYPEQCTQVLPSAVADAVTEVLRGVQEPGGFGYSNNLDLEQESAGKTGTAQNARAVWFVGYTPNLATAAMIAGANKEGQPIPLPGQTIGGIYRASASGSGFAGPIWGDAMKAIDEFLKDVDFVRPSGEDIAGLVLAVPEVNGLPVAEARRRLEQAGFTVSVVSYEVDSSYDQGTVAYTSPRGGSETSTGDVVTIYPSDGSPYVPPPPPEPEPAPKPPAPAPAPKPPKPGGGGGPGDD